MLPHKTLYHGKLLKRYKRFLADVELSTGEIITAHVANSGSMLGLCDEGNKVWCSKSDNPDRKLAYSLEQVEIHHFGNKMRVGINTSIPNALMKQAVSQNIIPELSGYESVRSEVKYGKNSRIDLFLEGHAEDHRCCYVEIKNVTLFRDKGLAEFPDAVTSRGAKHLDELSQMRSDGHRAAMLYCIQGIASHFKIASDIDPLYAQKLMQAHANGVEVIIKSCIIDDEGIAVNNTPIEWVK